jgi:hypothetical protein
MISYMYNIFIMLGNDGKGCPVEQPTDGYG